MADPHERLHASVKGMVQGVSFRYATQECALRLGLTGWVRNRPDGSVEVTAEGPRLALDQLLAFLHRGPPMASVSDVRAEWAAASGEFRDFDVRF